MVTFLQSFLVPRGMYLNHSRFALEEDPFHRIQAPVGYQTPKFSLSKLHFFLITSKQLHPSDPSLLNIETKVEHGYKKAESENEEGRAKTAQSPPCSPIVCLEIKYGLMGRFASVLLLRFHPYIIHPMFSKDTIFSLEILFVVVVANKYCQIHENIYTMKVSVAALVTFCLTSSTDAFTAPSMAGRVSVSMSSSTVDKVDAAAESSATPAAPVEDSATREKFEALMDQEDAVKEESKADESWKLDPKKRVQVGRYNDIPDSIALPFLKRPNKLDGSHAGDFGFDPLGFTETYDLYTMQEAELRHARLAMLAVIGWPMSELLAPDWMLQHGMAPSVLNGFNPVSFVATALIFGTIGWLEYLTALRRTSVTKFGLMHREDMANVWNMGVAGDYNFDPLDLYSSIGDDASARKGLREVEISHGRSAMLGITAFAMWEKLTGHPIVENSMFFHPNLLLPALVGAGVFASSIYEFTDSEEYPLQLQVSSEGQARLNSLQRSIDAISEKAQAASEKAEMDDKMDKTIDFLGSLKEKYDSLTEDYTDGVMKNYK